MKITSNKKNKVFASDSLSGLKRQIKINLTDDICTEIVDMAYSEDGTFEGDAFIDADTFWDIHSADDAQELVLRFFNGEDLDAKGQANPNRDYFRYNGYENIESTDYPGDIYLDQLDDEITDYIMEHLDDREFPDELQKIIDKYFDDKE
jgi:hypothetical protein